MKRIIMLAGTLLGGLALCSLLAIIIFHDYNTVYPTSESESVFLKEYSPQPVVEKFRTQGSNMSWSGGKTGGAGEGFVHHEGTFEGRFAIWPRCSKSLITSLSSDVAAQLVTDKAIFQQTGDPQSGFHFTYKIGKNLGFLEILPISIDPVRPVSTSGVPLIEDDAIPVIVYIRTHETYFPDETKVQAYNLVN